MFIFPCLYIISFFSAVYKLFKGKQDAILIFLIAGLPIYITSLSIANMYGFTKAIPTLQVFKEIVIVVALFTFVWKYNRKLNLHIVDWLVIIYTSYNALYIFLPLGNYSFIEKLIAFKGISFFPFVYFAGRLCNLNFISLNKWFNYICLLAIITGVVLLFEIIPYQHLQTYTGYADYNQIFFNVEPAGNFGLTWTFESINGIKRFASFFSMPLELAAATLISISVITALVTDKKNKIKINYFTLVAFLFTLLSITFAFSRAAFASYFMMLYMYILITKNKVLLKLVHWGIVAILIAVLSWLKGDIYEVVTTTIDFSDSSSISHLIEWLAGIQSIAAHPLGLGLGYSGRIAGSFGENIGGENQLIIIGVQTGVISILLYISVYWLIIKYSFQIFNNSKSEKERKLGLMLALLKIGIIIPLLTSEVETYLYISYFIWFFSGLLISTLALKVDKIKNLSNP